MSNESTQRVSLPAARDPNRNPDGTFAVGNKASPGRKRGSRNWRRVIEGLPTDLDELRADVASTLGIDVDRVPADLDPLDLLWWMRRRQALRGNESAIGDFTDRDAPKPRRLEHSGPDGGPMRMLRHAVASSADAGEAEAAAAYLDELPRTEEEE